MILFSIPVHEQPEVVVNQVENFTFFNRGCQIVLHVSAWMPDADVAKMKNLLQDKKHVHFAERRIWSGYADGSAMKMHVITYSYAQQLGLSFDYFCLHASNDMFVRPGLIHYLKDFDAGHIFSHDTDNTGWLHMQRAMADRSLKRMMRKYNIAHIAGGQVEGSFYKKSIMDVIADRIRKDGYYEIGGYAHGHKKLPVKITEKKIPRYIIRKINKGLLYAKEEIYFPTLSQDLVHKRAPFSYCYINWAANLKLTVDEINLIRLGNFGDLPFIKLKKEAVDVDKLQFFAVKRVDRKINDPIRQYITSLQHS